MGAEEKERVVERKLSCDEANDMVRGRLECTSMEERRRRDLFVLVRGFGI